MSERIAEKTEEFEQNAANAEADAEDERLKGAAESLRVQFRNFVNGDENTAVKAEIQSQSDFFSKAQL